MTIARRLVFAAAPPAAVLTAFVAAFVACDEDPRYVYTARHFDSTAGCLEDYEPVETVPGDGVSATCPESCLTVGKEVYVSTMCPPVPAIATALDSDAADCLAALDASYLEASCSGGEADGGEDEAGGEEETGAPDGDTSDAPAPMDAGKDARDGA